VVTQKILAPLYQIFRPRVCDDRHVETAAQSELAATVAARKELGPEHEEHLIAGFLERIETEIDRRVDERIGHRRQGTGGHFSPQELGVFVPIFIAAGIFGGPAGIFAVAAVLIVVFLVHTFHGR
jgi:hypothetical protein